MDSATDLTVDKVCSDFSLGQSDLGKYGKDLEIRMVTLVGRSGLDSKHESDQVTDLGFTQGQNYDLYRGRFPS